MIGDPFNINNETIAKTATTTIEPDGGNTAIAEAVIDLVAGLLVGDPRFQVDAVPEGDCEE
jgi:hypothetical protein